MKKRMLAALLSGMLVFSQVTPALAADVYSGTSESAEEAAEEAEEADAAAYSEGADSAFEDGTETAGADAADDDASYIYEADQEAEDADDDAEDPDIEETASSAIGEEVEVGDDDAETPDFEEAATSYAAVEEAGDADEAADEDAPEEADGIVTEEVADSAVSFDAAQAILDREAAGSDDLNYDFEGDRSLLNGWDGTIDGHRNVFVRTEENPDGFDAQFEITDVEVISGDELLSDFHKDNDGDDWWWYYRMAESGMGTAVLKVTYTDVYGKSQSYELKLNVTGDVFSVYMDSADKRRDGLPGAAFELYAEADHEYYDENGDYQDSREGFSYEWGFEYGGEYAEIIENAADPARPTLRFNDLPEGESGIDEDIRVYVKVFYDGEEVAYDSTGFYVMTDYYEICPTDLNTFLDAGDSITGEFEVRHYNSSGKAEQGYNDEGFVSVSGVTWFFKDMDENRVRVTAGADGSGEILHNDDRTEGNVFTITRLDRENTNFKICAEWDDGGYAERQYNFNWRNYDLWFDEHDREVFDDADSAELRLNIGNLTNMEKDWTDLYDLDITVGSWTDEGADDSWKDEDGWIQILDNTGNRWYSYADSGEERVFTFTEELLKLEEIRDVRIWVDLRVKATGESLCDTDAWLHKREAEYDTYRGDENLFPGETRYIARDCGDTIRVKNSRYPDDAHLRIVVTGVSTVSDESEYDNRDAVTVQEDENGWEFTAVRSGYSDVTLTMNLLDGDEVVESGRQETFRYWVGDFRAWIDINSESGSLDILPGNDLNLAIAAGAEHQDQNGDRSQVDVSGMKIRVEVRAEWIDDEWLKQNRKEREEVETPGAYWTASFGGKALEAGTMYRDESDNPECWYVAEGSPADTVVISAKEGAPSMNLHIRVRLIDRNAEDPSDEWEIASTDRWVNVTYDTFEIGLPAGGEWDPDLPTGATYTLTPVMKKYVDGAETVITDEELAEIKYRLEWSENSGVVNSGNPPEVVIVDADGRTLTYGEDGGDVGTAPFSITRINDWNSGFDLIAFTENEAGQHEIARRAFHMNAFDPEVRFEAEPDRGDEDRTYLYTDESLTVTPTLTKLTALKEAGYPIEVHVRYGFWDWNQAENRIELMPVWQYETDEDGRRNEDSKTEFTLTSAEFDSDTGALSIAGGDRMNELYDVLRYQNDEWGNGRTELGLYLEAYIGTVRVCDRGFAVEINRAYQSLEDDNMGILPGRYFIYNDSKAMLYVEDSAHCSGNPYDDRPGQYYEVTITGIRTVSNHTSDPYGSDVFTFREEDGTRYIDAGEYPGDAEIEYTYTGGPDGSGTHTTWLHVDSQIFWIEAQTDFNVLIGESGTPSPKLIRRYYDPSLEEKYRTEEADPSKYVVECGDEDGRLIDLNYTTGEFKTLTECDTGFRIRISSEEYDCHEEAWVNVRSSAIVGVYELGEDVKMYVTPGETLKIEDDKVASLLPKTMKIRSLKNPDGTEVAVKQYYFGGTGPVDYTSDREDGSLNTMTVWKSLEDAVQLAPVTEEIYIEVQSENDFRAGTVLPMVVHVHAADEGTVTKAASCAEAGVKTFHCTICGEECRTEEIPATGSHTAGKAAVTKATLTKDGKIVTKCSVCGAVLKSTVISYPKSFKLAASSYVYDGKAKTPAVTVTDAKGKTIAASNYTVAYSANTNAGTAKVVITFKGNYSGTKELTFTITKAKNTMTAKAKSPSVKYSKVKKKNQTIKKTKAFTIKKAKGAVTFEKSKGSKKITISKTGKITVEKGLKKGTYTLTVKVTAAGDANYNKLTKKVKVKIKVK